jgi:VWFA-related protein
MRRLIQLAPLLVVAIACFGQQSPAPEWQTHVALPVVVMHKDGGTITGLSAQNFTISKGVNGGKLLGVKEVTPAEINGKRPIVIIFDGIGNPPDVQKTTRDAILAYVGDCARQQKPVNLIITTQNGPRLVHSSSTPAPVTLAALEQVDKATRALGGRFSSGVSPEEQAKLKDPIAAEFSRLKDFEQKVEVATFYRRFSVQFETLQLISNALMHTPGRKAVLWITSAFPVKVDEGKKLLGLGSTIATDTIEWWEMTTQYEKSVRLLNAAEISVYGAEPVKGGGGLAAGGFAGVGAGGNFTDLTFIGLSEIGSRTGGMLISFSTDTAKMVDAVEKDMGSYYLLDYELPPPRSYIDWKELGIKVSQDGAKVRKTDSMFLVADKTYYKGSSPQ